jgi:hypothetical protein
VAATQQFIDGTESFPSGVDSGIAPVLLKRSQCAWATNATFRGSLIRPRPAFTKIGVVAVDTTVDLTKLFQGAGYYRSDVGIGSIMAQIGGRLFQFIPDTNQGAAVYDRTPLSQASNIVVTTTKKALTTPGAVVLTNLSDTPGTVYGIGSSLVAGAKLLATSTNDISASSTFPFSFVATLHVQTNQPVSVNFVPVYFGSYNGIPIRWNIIAISGNTITLQYFDYIVPASATLNIPVGSPVQQIGAGYPTVLATTSTSFTAPATDATANVSLQQPNNLLLGQVVNFGGGNYLVSSFISGTTQYVDQTVVTVTEVPGTNYDTNPAGILQTWGWQSENYFIVNDGVSKPVIFDGVSSSRSTTPTFSGLTSAPFIIPEVGTTVSIGLGSDFTDGIGQYIEVSSYGLFPFLMQVIAIDGDQIVATNISGSSAVGDTVAANAAVQSIYNPLYTGEVTASFQMPPDNTTPISFQVSPNFTGAVGDTIVVTDGTGSFTTYTLLVTGINGSQITATLVSGLVSAKISIGFAVISQKTQPNQLPPGRMGAYVQGRNWVSNIAGTGFFVTDLVGSSSGTAQFNYRDAVLNWTQNTATFQIPGGFGRIQGIIALAALDASLGQGQLQILCDNGIFTCSASTDATTWASTTTPILAPSVLGMGGVGQNAMAIANADLLFKSGDGTLRDLEMARQDFIKWARLPISREVNRAFDGENPDLFQFISATLADNRFLIGCQPVKSPLGVYCQGIVSLDFDITSSLQGKLPSVYDGVWTGLNVLQLISGMFNGVQRTFAFVANTAAGVIELWEITKDGLFDGDGTQPITWSFELPVLFHEVKNKGSFELCSLQDGEIYISELVGKASVKSWYRPDYDECWHKWYCFDICADSQSVQPQYRSRLGIGKPPLEECDNPVGRPPNFGRFFQPRFEITGSLTFMAALFMATPEPQPKFAPVAGQNQGET